MKTIGIICEYDPFHRGHLRQFELIREKHPDALIVCLMSGPFTQRGWTALFSPWRRAETALRSGADLVLELPCAFAVRDGEHFALAGVDILNRLRFVDEICFGCEDDPAELMSVAAYLEHPDEAFSARLREYLAEGRSYPAAQGKALEALLPIRDQLTKPNNILAVSYLRALLKTGSAMKPFAVHREGDYHDRQMTDVSAPSAGAIRGAIAEGNTALAERACGYSFRDWEMCDQSALDTLLLWKIRNGDKAELSSLPYCAEGLENRLRDMAMQSTTREELLTGLKTRRYTYARLSRLCCHALLGITEAFLTEHPFADTVRILALRPSRVSALLRKSQIPILSNAADADPDDALFRLDETAYDLWSLGAGIPAGQIYRQKMIVL